MNGELHGTQQLSSPDRARIWWATQRYDLWLDLRFVKRSRRKELRSELEANLLEAASDVGATRALANVGSLRALAKEAGSDGSLRPRWYAGVITALSMFLVAGMLFLAQTLTWVQGVVDSGAVRPAEGSLFPFIGSRVIVDPSPGAGLSVSAEPGLVPFLLAVVVFLAVARPWRLFSDRAGATRTAM